MQAMHRLDATAHATNTFVRSRASIMSNNSAELFAARNGGTMDDRSLGNAAHVVPNCFCSRLCSRNVNN